MGNGTCLGPSFPCEEPKRRGNGALLSSPDSKMTFRTGYLSFFAWSFFSENSSHENHAKAFSMVAMISLERHLNSRPKRGCGDPSRNTRKFSDYSFQVRTFSLSACFVFTDTAVARLLGYINSPTLLS